MSIGIKINLMIPGIGGESAPDDDAATYFAAITTAGSTISQADKNAINTAVVSLKAASLWDKLDFVAPLTGDDLTAARVPLKQPAGLAAMTNNNFVSGDYAPATGLTSDGTKWLGTNFVCATGGVQTSTDCHLALYLADTPATRYATLYTHIGAASSHRMQLQRNNTSRQSTLSGANNSAAADTARSTPMYSLAVGCRSGNNLADYGNGVLYNSGTSATNSTTANKLAIGAESATAGTNAAPGVYCWASSGTNLTAGEVEDYNDIINTLMVALGRRSSITDLTGLTYYLVYRNGQSKAIGYRSAGAANPGFGTHYPSRHATALMPLVGTKPGATTVTALDRYCEFSHGRAGNDLGQQLPFGEVAHSIYAIDATKRLLFVCGGKISSSITVLEKGTSVYTEGMARVEETVDLVTSLGGTVIPLAFSWNQGSADDTGTPLATYATKLSQLQADVEADLNAICGTSEVIPMIKVQCQDFTRGPNRATAAISIAENTAAAANSDIWQLCPESLLESIPTDGVHYSAESASKIEGSYLAKAIYAKLEDEVFAPLRPISVTRSGADITVVFNKGGLRFDTSFVSDPSGSYASRKFGTAPTSATDTTVTNKLGFEFCDDNTTNPSAAISGFNGQLLDVININANFGTTNIAGDTLTVNLDGTPTSTNKRLRYGFTGTAGQDLGPTTGARGCLRDDDTSFTAASGQTTPNYCLVFDEAAT